MTDALPIPPRPAPTRSGHARLALAATAVACVLGLLVDPVPIAAQLAVLGAGVAIVGVPHGALDGRIGRAWLRPRLGRSWGAWFAAGYLLLVAAVVGAWVVAPVAALVGFLAISAVHFGGGDVGPGRGRFVAAIVRGVYVLALPALFHPSEVAVLFSWLVPTVHAEGAAGVARTLAVAGWCAVPAVVARLALEFARQGPASAWPTAAELVLLALAFATLPPLLGFGVYFCLWHAPRHLLAWLAEEEWPSLMRSALPATAATLLGMAAAAWLLSGDGLPQGAVRALFVGLSALTVPHMLLEWRAGADAVGLDAPPRPSAVAGTSPPSQL